MSLLTREQYLKLVQIDAELKYDRRTIRGHLRALIEGDDVLNIRMGVCVTKVNEWLREPSSYDSLDKLKADFVKYSKLETSELIEEIMLVIFEKDSYVPVQTVCGITAQKLGFDVFDGVKLVGEVIGIMAELDMFDVTLAEPELELPMMVQCDLVIAKETRQMIKRTKYLPPMVCPPKWVNSNRPEQYMNHSASLVLGGEINHHNKKLSLDVINIMNQQALSLDEEIAASHEVPNKVLDTWEKQMQFNDMALASKEVYRELIEQGNKFYFTHKYDKRGRLYSQGYHVNIQSTEFKKAIINLAEPICITQ